MASGGAYHTAHYIRILAYKVFANKSDCVRRMPCYDFDSAELSSAIKRMPIPAINILLYAQNYVI